MRSYTYSRAHRMLEIVALVAALGMLARTAQLIGVGLGRGAWLTATLWLCGGLGFADFASGVVHWAADTYGSPTMPIFGGFVRTFREHHAWPTRITEHDFVETNGDVCIFSSPVYVVLLCVVRDPFVLSFVLGVFAGSYTNSQIHKWAHMASPPRLVRWLQRARLLLSPAHHQQHHAGAHRDHYCITTGWMNAILDGTRFFRVLEWLLARVGIHSTAGAPLTTKTSLSRA